MRARVRSSQIKLKRMADQPTDLTEMAWLNGVTKQCTSRVKSPSFLLSLRNAEYLWKQQNWLISGCSNQLKFFQIDSLTIIGFVIPVQATTNMLCFMKVQLWPLAEVPTKSQRRIFRQYYYYSHLFLFSNSSNIFLMFVLLLLLNACEPKMEIKHLQFSICSLSFVSFGSLR